KLPLIALAGAASIATIIVAGHATVSLETLPLADRLGNAVVSTVRYVGMMAWPTGLAVYYPFPAPWPLGTIAAAAAVLIALGAAAVALRTSAPWVGFGVAWYMISLLPVIGIMQAGMQGMADRFTYLPSIGLLVAVVWSAAALVAARPTLRLPATAAL